MEDSNTVDFTRRSPVVPVSCVSSYLQNRCMGEDLTSRSPKSYVTGIEGLLLLFVSIVCYLYGSTLIPKYLCMQVLRGTKTQDVL